MTTPLLTWSAIVALLLLIIIVRLWRAFIFCAKGQHRFMEFGSEREEFFIPGDPMTNSMDEDYDFEAFDDL